VSDDRTIPTRSTGQPIRALRVEVVKGAAADIGKVHVSEADRITVGTADGNDVKLSDETVSRYHLELIRREDQIEVQDHGSTNGTAVGPVFVTRGAIKPGTSLTLGNTTISVTDGEPVTLEALEEEVLGRLRGREPIMRRLMASVKRAAASEVSILLLGETGTGKEVIAHAIHDHSPRAKFPFETVDCGALLPTLIASELFGHERGAFTGADQQHIGAFERAHGGTIFLDEIGELPPAVQAALLGALERRSFRRLGGQKAIQVDVRVISATHRDLRSEVNSGQFRQDLYYRIGVLLLRVPPLRERPGDIPLLLDHFLREGGYDGDLDVLFPSTTIGALKAHHWPGNVRELRNFVDAALAMGQAPALDSHPGAQPAPPAAEKPAAATPTSNSAPKFDQPYSEARAQVLQDFELAYFNHLLENARGNVSLAARRAKMDRSYLMQILKRHGIKVRRDR
jgi:DNA-binding NtrC family response regulator